MIFLKRKNRNVNINFIIINLLLIVPTIVNAAESIINIRTDKDEVNIGKSSGEYQSAAVASENAECSNIGKEILLQGNAVDAAISTLLCIGVINNFSSGIGGGGFMVVRTGTGESRVFDFRETAPGSSSTEMFKDDPNSSKLGGKSVAVPGEIRGFYDAHTRFGRLPWSQLFEPNIRLAEEGFLMTKALYAMVKKFKTVLSPAMRETYLDSWGNPKAIGERITRPALGRTLRAIANEGPSAFYSGFIADALIAEINARGGNITKKDFEDYRTIEREVVTGTYRGYNVLTAGAPASGQILIEALNILSGFNLDGSRQPQDNPNELKRRAQIAVETMKFAYGSRMKLGDPSFVDIKDTLKKFEDKNWATKIREKISLKGTHPVEYYTDAIDTAKDHGTTHVSVLDSEGMAVSCTSTINLEFGSKIMDPVTGIILNNQMDDFSIPGEPNQFSLPPSPMNYPAPGKRPVSSSVPVIFERNGRVVLIAGGTGGSRIISSVLLALISMVDLEQSPIEAVNAPRYHHQLIPNFVIAENSVDDSIVKGLTSRGHLVNVMAPGLYYSSVQAIKKDLITGKILAAADPRKDGSTAGF